MVVLGPVVEQQQQLRGGDALQQPVEKLLGLRVDPVQILEHQDQRLGLRFAQPQALERIQGLAPPLRRIEPLPLRVVDRLIEQRQQRREQRLQRAVQREQLADDLLADAARVVAVADLEVALEQIDDRQIGRGLAVGHRAGLHHQPALGAVGVGELVEQPRLAHSRLAHDGHHLALALPGAGQRLGQHLELALPPHEARQPARGGRLQARARTAGAPVSS